MSGMLLSLRGVKIAPLPLIGLEVGRGESVAVLAGEGAGKSRLLRVMAGLLAPEAGEVVWQGEAGGIGVVFRVPDLRFLCATPREEVQLTPAARGLLAGEALRVRTEEALCWAGVEAGLWDREWSWLSAAGRYRVAVAAVFAARPQLMLFDEPGNMLSDAGEEGLVESLRHFAEVHGVATVIFTSRAARARRFAARVVSLNA
ncbi:MAG: ATP-binding cassette domain-containing protein [Magnetococcales bacterium]|nr:ATP-binding cassette domain-containing protein [Magnetococcales bacterium]